MKINKQELALFNKGRSRKSGTGFGKQRKGTVSMIIFYVNTSRMVARLMLPMLAMPYGNFSNTNVFSKCHVYNRLR